MRTLPALDRQELAAVLAGLRLVQHTLEHEQGFPNGIGQIYADGGPGLTSQQIDRLCQRLNVTLTGHA